MAKPAKNKAAAETKDAVQLILKNRKLHHAYAVVESFEAGMVLMGSEVKNRL